MATTAPDAPRLVNDTYRTLVSVAAFMLLSLLVSIAFVLVVLRVDLPAPGLTYDAASSLFGFTVFFVIYQLLTWWALRSASAEQLADWARQTTPRSLRELRLQRWTGSGARTWALTAALLALMVVLAVLTVPELRSNPVILTASLLVVASSWWLLVYAYAVAYLRLVADSGGLAFPEQAAPVWSDYVYLSVQVNATFSSSDVDLTTRAMRRMVTEHTILAFGFNTVIVALLVSALVTLAG